MKWWLEGLFRVALNRIGERDASFTVTKMLPPLLYATLLVITPFAASASPQVKIGNTTIIGRDVTLLQQDFFGGDSP